MKLLNRHIFWIFIISLITNSCADHSEDWIDFEIIKELHLSVPTAEESTIETDQVDFEFEILEGNGDYDITLDENDEKLAIINISDNKVTVNLLSQREINLIVTDKSGKKARIAVRSTHPSLEYNGINSGISIEIGEKYETKIIASGLGSPFQTAAPFGAGGPYTVEKIRGNAGNLYIENDIIHMEQFKPGNTSFKIMDKRGTYFVVNMTYSLQFEISSEEKELHIEGDNNLSAYITLKWGDKWEIISETNHITESVSVARPINVEPDSEHDYYFISIHTSETGKGKDIYKLKNSDNETITVTMNIK